MQSRRPPFARSALAAAATGALFLALPALASAHARVSPPVSLANELQLYSLAVPTEKTGLTTRKIVLTVPAGFGIDSFAPPPPGWHMRTKSTGSGGNAVVETVTWTGGRTPTGEDSLFQFLAQAPAGTYTFHVEQTYSDGSIVDWNGPETAAAPAPTIEIKDSLGGSGTPLVAIIALVVAVLALLAAGFALVGGRGGNGPPARPLV
jgi:uncharacterized protein YcnI